MTIHQGHVDLFTGLGGFTLAAHWAGFKTVVMCEADEFRCAGLRKAWPGVPIIKDVREFDGKEWQGAAILTAGVPCQPASRAGKQRGAADDRWLWGEAVRVLSEARPTWAVFENPPGILDVGFDGVLDDVEACGYETATVDIPACGVDSPQRRHRLWLVGYTKARHAGQSKEQSHDYKERENTQKDGKRFRDESAGSDIDGPVAHAQEHPEWAGLRPAQARGGWWGRPCYVPCGDGKWRRAKPGVCGLAHGVSRKLLAALGDSIVPEVAYRILRSIRKAQ